MAFVRSKKIRGNTYYYLVQSRRVGGKVVQKVLRYYGVQKPAKAVLKKKRFKKKRK